MTIASIIMAINNSKNSNNGPTPTINIVPSSDLRNNYSRIHDLSTSTGEPVYITKNGYADGVFFSMEAFESYQNKLILRFEREVMEKRYYEDIISMSRWRRDTTKTSSQCLGAKVALRRKPRTRSERSWVFDRIRC